MIFKQLLKRLKLLNIYVFPKDDILGIMNFLNFFQLYKFFIIFFFLNQFKISWFFLTT